MFHDCFLLLNQVKHTFSYDITGLDLCYLISGRDIVHLLVEARGHSHKVQMRGSDEYNLIPYPLIKAVGAEIYTLEGHPFGSMIYNPQGIFDFIAGVNINLVEEFIQASLKQVG